MSYPNETPCDRCEQTDYDLDAGESLIRVSPYPEFGVLCLGCRQTLKSEGWKAE